VNVTLNALEIFEIAEQIEQNGARFYKRSAEIFGEPVICRIFLKLADWELKHKEIFSGMKKQYAESNPGSGASGPERTLQQAKTMAGLAVFGIKPNPSDELSGKEGKSDILRRAIEKEKDSIVFYSGLRDFAPAASAKEKIDEIIREELRHIIILNKVWQKTT